MTEFHEFRKYRLILGICVGLVAVLVWKLFPERSLPSTANSIGMRFVRIPSGKFLMGSPDDEPGRGDDETLHEVTIAKPFNLGIHEVTIEQYHRVMGSDAKPSDPARVEAWPLYPADDVTWDKANLFCQKLSELPEEKAAKRSYRLPTEAEWEYACRAGKKSHPVSSGGRFLPPEPKRSEEAKPVDTGSRPVGSFAPNSWGLQDMQGNVWEWCSDWYGPYSTKLEDNFAPTGPKEGDRRVARGGSRLTPFEDYRNADRVALNPEIRLGMGFRVVMIEEK